MLRVRRVDVITCVLSPLTCSPRRVPIESRAIDALRCADTFLLGEAKRGDGSCLFASANPATFRRAPGAGPEDSGSRQPGGIRCAIPERPHARRPPPLPSPLPPRKPTVAPTTSTGSSKVRSARAAYHGKTDDLLTAGRGAAGIQGAAPAFADPLNPTRAELRRRAIYNNYLALVDVTSNGGYGTCYGPDVGLDAAKLPNDGKVAGEEYLAFAGDGSGMENVSLMVQVPASFDPKNPCIVTGASSGSRGIYGAIGTSGDWGLCAAARWPTPIRAPAPAPTICKTTGGTSSTALWCRRPTRARIRSSP